MKKLIYFAFAALAMFAFSSCSLLDDLTSDLTNEDDPTYEYYKPLIGTWEAIRFSGQNGNESFNYDEIIQQGHMEVTFNFSTNKLMTMKLVDNTGGNNNSTVSGNVIFGQWHNYFTTQFRDQDVTCEIKSNSNGIMELALWAEDYSFKWNFRLVKK